MGVAANMYILHQPITVVLAPGATRPNSVIYTQPTPPGDLEHWATLPEEFRQTLGQPTRWLRYPHATQRLYIIEWTKPEENPGWWARLSESRTGFPWTARSMKTLAQGPATINNKLKAFSIIWPRTNGQYLTPATTYYPLGLIANPIVYALPPWCVLLLLRHTLIRYRSRRRIARAQCPHCAYDLSATQDLPTCPECGHATPEHTHTHAQ